MDAMTEERWTQIRGFPAGYEISDHGRVRHGAKELKKTVDRYGYERIPLRGAGRVASLPSVHRLVALHFVGDCPPGYVTAHLDGTRRNNHFSNLAFVTVAENNRHKTVHRTLQAGSRHGMAKLSDDTVEEILRLVKPGDREFGVKPIAKRFGISDGTVRKIMRGDSWRGSSRAISLTAEIDRLKQENAALRQALRPFERANGYLPVGYPDEEPIESEECFAGFEIKAKHLRAAAELLAEADGE